MEMGKMRMLRFLRETKNYYSCDPVNRRAFDDENGCSYLTPDGRKCAIGRHLTEEELSSHGNFLQGKNVRTLAIEFNLLFKIFYEFPIDFLQAMQDFHDMNVYWDTEGLTKLGKEAYRGIQYRILRGRYCEFR